jgi:hypothetical protein
LYGIVAYEKTNLWKSNVENPDRLAVLFSDGRVDMMLVSKLAQLIKSPKPTNIEK